MSKSAASLLQAPQLSISSFFRRPSLLQALFLSEKKALQLAKRVLLHLSFA